MTGPTPMSAAAPSFPDPSANNNMSPMQNAWTTGGTMPWEVPSGMSFPGQGLPGELPQHGAVPPRGGYHIKLVALPASMDLECLVGFLPTTEWECMGHLHSV
jgi:hypothetical protein